MQPMSVLLAVLMLTVAHSAKVKIKDNGQCSIHHNGCMYQLVLRDANCMQGDSPANPNDLEHLLSGPDNDIILETPVDKATKKAAVEEMREEKQEMKKLDELERKLTKMMEGLSVRSLRHIRQIRNDLRQMTSTMDLIKQQSGSRKSKRGLPCPPEFVRVGTWQSCYRFSNFNTTWHEAREYCSAFGADLVSLDTLKESYILDYLIKSSPGKTFTCFIQRGWDKISHCGDIQNVTPRAPIQYKDIVLPV